MSQQRPNIPPSEQLIVPQFAGMTIYETPESTRYKELTFEAGNKQQWVDSHTPRKWLVVYSNVNEEKLEQIKDFWNKAGSLSHCHLKNKGESFSNCVFEPNSSTIKSTGNNSYYVELSIRESKPSTQEG